MAHTKQPTKQADSRHPDIKPPAHLKATQEWFAGIISKPLNADGTIADTTPSGTPTVTEAAQHLRPSPTLQPHERIQIYNQQIWWRFYKTFHNTFPLLTRLFGRDDFNRTIATPYLQCYPSRHWSLHWLGDRLPQWIDEHYSAKDKTLVYNAAVIDTCYLDCQVALERPPLTFHDHLETRKLALQPYLHLLSFPCDLLSFRDAFIAKDHEHWLKHDFPPLILDGDHHFVIHRTPNKAVVWKEISTAEIILLRAIQKGASLHDACDTLEAQNPDAVDDALERIAFWFREWAVREWLIEA